MKFKQFVNGKRHSLIRWNTREEIKPCKGFELKETITYYVAESVTLQIYVRRSQVSGSGREPTEAEILQPVSDRARCSVGTLLTQCRLLQDRAVCLLKVTMASSGRTYSGKEVALHNSRESCWIIVHGGCMIPASIGLPHTDLILFCR
jgi:hypothetical protein